jgi:antitoxin VapB
MRNMDHAMERGQIAGHMAWHILAVRGREAIAVPEERRVHLFRNGRNQALRIPREWELDADEALLRREDGVLTVVPVPREGLLPWLATLEPLDVPLPVVGDDDLLPLDEPTW